jgi:hypothetical protein
MGVEGADHNPPGNVKASVSAFSSALDIAVHAPYGWVAETPQSICRLSQRSRTMVAAGRGTGSPSGRIRYCHAQFGIAYPDTNGYAGTTVQTHNLSGQPPAGKCACVSPGFTLCDSYGKQVGTLQYQISTGIR